LAQKLGIKSGHWLALINAPDGFELDLPADVSVGDGICDIIVAFYTERAALVEGFAGLAAALQPAGGLWIAWPKKSSGVATNLNDNLVREVGLAAGLVDNKVCAVTDIWSGLRFVYRLKDRRL